MRNIKYIFGVAIVAVLFPVILQLSSCRKEESAVMKDAQIKETRNWFNLQYGNNIEFDKKGKQVTGWFYPDWRFAKKYLHDGYTIVEAPIFQNRKTLYYQKAEYVHLTASKTITTISKLVVFEKNGKRRATIMTVVGNKKYITAHSDLSVISVNNVPADFSGLIFYQQPNKVFLKGWMFENGKMIRKVKPHYRASTSRSNHKESDLYEKKEFYNYENCQKTTYYINTITDIVAAGPFVEQITDGPCDPDNNGNSDGDNSGDEGDQDPNQDPYNDPSYDPDYNPWDGFLEDPFYGVDPCFIYPNPFCDCYNGQMFNCSFDSDQPASNPYQFLSTDEDYGNEYQLEFFSGPAIDLHKYLKCFDLIPDLGASYTIEICADIPNNQNVNKLHVVGQPGHAFITLTKKNGNSSISQSFGFYPKVGWLSVGMQNVDSKLCDDSEHEYNASLKMDISFKEFEIVKFSALFNSQNIDYDLNDYNCTNYALKVINSIRPNNPLIVTDWLGLVGNYGQTPNGLYELLNNMKNQNSVENIKTGTFNSVKSNGPCN